MYQRNAIPNGQKQENVSYLVHHSHSQDEPLRDWKEPYLQIVSIDPSTKNLGFRIERRHPENKIETLVFERISFIPTAKERRKNGLEPLENPNKIEIIPTLYRDITNFLSQYINYYRETHIFIIERQLAKNYKCVRVAQHVISYFTILLADTPLFPLIIEIDNQEKFKRFMCPKGLNERGKKQWLIQRVIELCKFRDDDISYQTIIRSKGKQDDYADTIAQIEAYCVIAQLPTFLHAPHLITSSSSSDLVASKPAQSKPVALKPVALKPVAPNLVAPNLVAPNLVASKPKNPRLKVVAQTPINITLEEFLSPPMAPKLVIVNPKN